MALSCILLRSSLSILSKAGQSRALRLRLFVGVVYVGFRTSHLARGIADYFGLPVLAAGVIAMVVLDFWFAGTLPFLMFL